MTDETPSSPDSTPPSAQSNHDDIARLLLAEKERELDEEDKERVDKRKDRAVSLIGVAIAFAATFSAVISTYEAHETRKEAYELTNKALNFQSSVFQAQERPYLIFAAIPSDQLALDKPQSGYDMRVQTPLILSEGKSPAFDISLTCETMKGWNDDWPALVARKSAETHVYNYLAPNQTEYAGCAALGEAKPDTPEKTPAYFDTNYFFGLLTYKDGLGKAYATPFCQLVQRIQLQDAQHISYARYDCSMQELKLPAFQ